MFRSHCVTLAITLRDTFKQFAEANDRSTVQSDVEIEYFIFGWFIVFYMRLMKQKSLLINFQ